MLLSRNQIMNLLHNITEYDGRKMPIETFVSVILDMLDTQEKVRATQVLTQFVALISK